VRPGRQDEFLHLAVLFRKNAGHWKSGGEPHAWFSGSSIAFSVSNSIMTSIFDGHRGLGNSGFSGGVVSGRMLCSEEYPESLD